MSAAYPFIPSYIPGETAYSLCAGIHASNGARCSTRTSLLLLGVPHGARQHDVSPHFARLGEVLGYTGTATKLLARKNTIAAYYAPFTESATDFIGDPKTLDRPRQILRALGAVSRTMRIDHPLKWCDACVVADAARVGRPYWHIEHQFPTTWMCKEHEGALQWLPGRPRRWLLPGADAISGAQGPALMPSEAALALAHIGCALMSLDTIDVSMLRTCAIDRMRELGVLHKDARFAHHQRIVDWFRSSKVGQTLSKAECDLKFLTEADWIAPQLVRQRRSNAVRWLVLWAALHDQSPASAASRFIDACKGLRKDSSGQFQLFGELPAVYRAPSRVWAALKHVQTYDEAKRFLGASRSDIVRWLESDPSLRSMWKMRLESLRTEESKERVLGYLKLDPQTTASQLERCCGADLKWLRARAPSFLREIQRGLLPRSNRQRDLFAEPSVGGNLI